MADTPRIRTERLQLLPVSEAMAWAAINDDRAELETLVGCAVPDSWPSDVAPILPMYANLLRDDPQELGWGPWLAVDPVLRSVVGDLGFKGRVTDGGVVELGYGVLEQHRGRGYATEATHALVHWALDQPGVMSVIAECEPDNVGSIRVLEKLGMERTGVSGQLLHWRLLR